MQWDLRVHGILCFLGGKSAIMTGIVVALGGRAAQTSRGLSLKNFVKKGCRCVCCGSILSLVQIFFSFVFGYGNV